MIRHIGEGLPKFFIAIRTPREVCRLIEDTTVMPFLCAHHIINCIKRQYCWSNWCNHMTNNGQSCAWMKYKNQMVQLSVGAVLDSVACHIPLLLSTAVSITGLRGHSVPDFHSRAEIQNCQQSCLLCNCNFPEFTKLWQHAKFVLSMPDVGVFQLDRVWVVSWGDMCLRLRFRLPIFTRVQQSTKPFAVFWSRESL